MSGIDETVAKNDGLELIPETSVKKTAIFIDGPALFHIGRILGIANFRFHVLRKILIENVGGGQELFTLPTYVLPKIVFDKIGKLLKNTGYNPVSVNTRNGQDDKFIINEIKKLDPSEVGKLVLVTKDNDFFEVLAEKRDAGIEVFVVGTSLNDPRDGQNSTSDVMVSSFNFVELSDYKTEIMEKAWMERPRITEMADEQASSLISLTGTVKMISSHEETLSLLSELTRICAKFPKVHLSLDAESVDNNEPCNDGIEPA